MTEGLHGPQVFGSVLPSQPKARFFDRRFWVGAGFGAVVGSIVLVGGLLVFTLVTMRAIGRSMASPTTSSGSFALPAPPFPWTQTADYGLKVEGLDGTPLDAATLRGKVVFLNFWATWCGPCRLEMPAIQRLYERVKGSGVVFLAVSDESREKIGAFLNKNPYTFPVYRITGERPAAYRTDGIPATFILAPDGTVAFKHVGSAAWDDISTVGFLKSLMTKGD